LRILRDREGMIPLVLNDVVMPGMSGREPATQIQGLQRDLKVL
jgi:CheY-like chemotaxis protein